MYELAATNPPFGSVSLAVCANSLPVPGPTTPLYSVEGSSFAGELALISGKALFRRNYFVEPPGVTDLASQNYTEAEGRKQSSD
jgi:hypothetical protein